MSDHAPSPSASAAISLDDLPLPPKRPRASRPSAPSRVRGKKGRLSGFMRLPLDMVFQICTHLEVPDLFTLSNCSKATRAVVTGPSSAGLWKRARAAMAMPELEVPMTDLQYAALMFGKGCDYCDRKNAGKPDPYYRKRICTQCLKDHFAMPDAFFDPSHPIFNFHALALETVPHTLPHGRDGIAYNKSDVSDAKELITRKFGSNPNIGDVIFVNRHSHVERGGWPLTEAERALLPEPSTPFQEWYMEKDEARRLREKDGRALRNWITLKDDKKTRENRRKRFNRQDDIAHRLGPLGFLTTECHDWHFKRHPLVAKPGPLSDRTWSTKVEPVLVQVLEERRRDRKKAGFGTLARDLRGLLPDLRSGESISPWRMGRISADLLDEVSEFRDGLFELVFVQLPSIRAAASDASNNSSAVDLLVGELRTNALAELRQLIRDRREGLVRSIAKAYMDLKLELDGSYAEARRARETEEERREREGEDLAQEKQGADKGKGKEKAIESSSDEEEAEQTESRDTLDQSEVRSAVGMPQAVTGAGGKVNETSSAGASSCACRSSSTSPAFEGYLNLATVPPVLLRLPPWIPRKEDDPIVATDEQLAAFLDTSPLAQFECTVCHKLFDTEGIFDHVSTRWTCVGPMGSRTALDLDEWMKVKGSRSIAPLGSETPSVKMDKSVLDLSLRIRCVRNLTTRRVEDVMAEDAEAKGEPWRFGVYRQDKAFVIDVDCLCNTGLYHHLVEHRYAQDAPARVKPRISWTTRFRRYKIAMFQREQRREAQASVDPPLPFELANRPQASGNASVPPELDTDGASIDRDDPVDWSSFSDSDDLSDDSERDVCTIM
ncbi:hypothetical protein JCM10212_003281 [Sporobolomyces blumeae]